jgi:hypothetical protein
LGDKIAAGGLLLKLIDKKGPDAWNGSAVWALGRLGARVPAYGLLNTVIDVETAEKWLEFLLARTSGERNSFLAVMLLARKTDDRYRDISPALRTQVVNWMLDRQAPEHYRVLVEQGGRLEDEEQDKAFGESLPPGLHLAG